MGNVTLAFYWKSLKPCSYYFLLFHVTKPSTRGCHVKYYNGDKKYSCLVGIGLSSDPLLSTIHLWPKCCRGQSDFISDLLVLIELDETRIGTGYLIAKSKK